MERACTYCQRTYEGEHWLCRSCTFRARFGLFIKAVLALLLAIGMIAFDFWLVVHEV